MDDENVRICDICGAVMRSGYLIDDGLEYYCSDDCLSAVYSAEEWDQMCAEDRGYWTEWEDEYE